MECRRARNRIADHYRNGTDIAGDRELIRHLKICPLCARDFGAEQTLNHLLASSRIDDTSGIVPMARRKAEIEARVAAGESKAGSVGRFVPGFLKRKPTLSFGTVVSVALLAVLALVPFKYHETIGYKLRMEGVNHKLVGDIENICDILSDLGLEDAEVNVLGCDTVCGDPEIHDCDTTCQLMILELKTREEAERVVAAFARIEPSELTTSIEPIRTSVSGSLLDQANKTLLQGSIDSN